MNSLFDKLNLRPNERRLVIIVAIIVFIILNAIFVWPHFGDWGRLQKRQREASALLMAYEDEVRKMPQYQAKLNQLEKAGASVSSEDQALKLSTTIMNQVALSGVEFKGYVDARQTSSGSAKSNQFFEEKGGNLTMVADEKALVDFLHKLGVGGSLIRVRGMVLSPDVPARQKLQGTLTLVASYAKKAPPKATPPSSAPPRTNAAAPTVAASARSTNNAARSAFQSGRTNAASRTTPP